jgi:uncharacterized protein (TIGR01244 family)
MIEPKVVIPDQFAVMPQPSPDDVASLAEQGYRSIINNRPDNEKDDQPKAEEVRAAAREHGLDYEHMPVTMAAITREDVDAFRQHLTLARHPVVAHCATGKRSFVLWAAGEVIHGGRSVDELVSLGRELGLDAQELSQVVDRVS